MVLRFRVENFAELAFLCPLAAGDDLRPVVGRLGHHVFHPGLIDGLDQPFQLFHGQTGRHRADDVFAGFHRFGCHPGMKRRRSEDPNRVELGMLEELSKVVVGVVGAINLAKRLQAVGANIANRADLAFGLQVPLESRPEPPPTTPMRTFLPSGRGPGAVAALEAAEAALAEAEAAPAATPLCCRNDRRVNRFGLA